MTPYDYNDDPAALQFRNATERLTALDTLCEWRRVTGALYLPSCGGAPWQLTGDAQADRVQHCPLCGRLVTITEVTQC